MPPSQLKQLKSSLREHGVLGPQKSKKQKQASAKDASKRLQRTAALEGIRERFNPFEVKAPARKDKFEVFTANTKKPVVGRPGVTRGFGEERRKETLLREMQRRNKVGGLVDRRFGENDPSMTPEVRAAERFARQNERKLKKSSIFNLEDDSEEEFTLTHAGRSLDFEEGPAATDDFQEDDLGDEEVAEFEEDDDRPRKRVRMDGDEAAEVEGEEDGPLRKKSKHEVMQEVIAKSKMYKAERQAAKEDDDELRRELDGDMNDFYEALRSQKKPGKTLPSPPTTDSEPAMNPDRAAMLSGKSREDADKEYQANLRKLKLDARSQPTTRTKTEEEKAAESAAQLQELERKRLRRMKGEDETSDGEDEVEAVAGEDEDPDDAEEFGLAQPDYEPRGELDVEDEDDFLLDDDLIESGSDAELASIVDEEEDEDEESISDIEDDYDDDNDDLMDGTRLPETTTAGRAPAGGRFTFPCPQTEQDLQMLTKDTPIEELPVLVQRVRTLYHKSLAKDNQQKLDNFAAALVKYVAKLAGSTDVPFAVLETLIRHIHSMAKASPLAVGNAFREELQLIAEERPLQLEAGDLLTLTAIASIFPTSDHFHSIATPAMLTMTRYLGQSSLNALQNLATGTYCCSLALQYQSTSKRYIPEVISYIVNSIAILAPNPIPSTLPLPGTTTPQPLNIHLRQPDTPLRILNAVSSTPTKLSFQSLISPTSHPLTPTSILQTLITLCLTISTHYTHLSAYPELITPLLHSLTHLVSPKSTPHLPTQILTLTRSTLSTLTSQHSSSLTLRRPLLLHAHRPRPIKSSHPQFNPTYNPDRHYDPDASRAEMSKLKAEHKRERKGAMRELRKDAAFMSRESLREKKERDQEYEKKYRRLVGEIQGETGQEEREGRKKGRKGR